MWNTDGGEKYGSLNHRRNRSAGKRLHQAARGVALGWPGKESTILLQISAMPTDAFLKAVDEDVNLTADEKTLIAKWTRGPGAYTHARLAKYKQGENLFIAIDRYRPTEDMVKDSQGQIRGVGPCGSIMVLKMREGRWEPEGASFYD